MVASVLPATCIEFMTLETWLRTIRLNVTPNPVKAEIAGRTLPLPCSST
jgi:hypothetical protein